MATSGPSIAKTLSSPASFIRLTASRIILRQSAIVVVSVTFSPRSSTREVAVEKPTTIESGAAATAAESVVTLSA